MYTHYFSGNQRIKLIDLEREYKSIGMFRAKWGDLDSHIKNIKHIFSNLFIWKEIERDCFGKESIDRIIDDGWEIKRSKGFLRGEGAIFPKEKLIKIGWDTKGYLRDELLFHELVHIKYDFLEDSMLNYENPFRFVNNAVSEWLGRKWRSNPNLLRHAIISFGLKEYIYDKISCEAFGSLELTNDKQLLLSFMDQYDISYRFKVFMD